MEFNFKGQTAVVTGGTRGIGRGVSEALLKAGAKVVATYQSNDKAAKEFAESRKEYSECLDLRSFDVTKYTQVEDFYRYIEETYGEFQILVHCSGIRIDSIVGMMQESDWRKVIDTNLTGTFNTCKFAVQNMMRKKYGRIIIITSPIGKFGFLGQSNYAASMAGGASMDLWNPYGLPLTLVIVAGLFFVISLFPWFYRLPKIEKVS